MDWYESVTGHRGQKIEDTSSQEDSVFDTQQDMMSTYSGDMDVDSGDLSYSNHDTMESFSSQTLTPKPFQSTPHLEIPPTQPSQFQLGGLGLSSSLASDSRDLSIERSNTNSEAFVADAADNLITAMTKKMNNRPRRPSQHSDEGIDLESENTNLSQPQRQMLQKVLLAALERLSDDSPAAAEPSDNKQDWFQCDICSKRTRLRCEMK